MIWTLGMGFPGVSVVKNLPARQNMWVQSLGQEDPLDKEMVRVSSILAWKIPWAEEPGILQSMGSQRIRHDLVTKQQQPLDLIWPEKSLHIISFRIFCKSVFSFRIKQIILFPCSDTLIFYWTITFVAYFICSFFRFRKTCSLKLKKWILLKEGFFEILKEFKT